MLSRFFINRPIFATVLSILIVVAGVITLRSLPVEQYPTITPPTVVVEAQYPGANATTIAQMVATPIEQQVNGVEGIQCRCLSAYRNLRGRYRPRHGYRSRTEPGEHDPKLTSSRSDKNRGHHHQRIHQRGHVSHVDLR